MNPSHLSGLRGIVKLILSCFCLPRLHLTTGVLSMKPWIRKTVPVSPLLFVHTRQQNTEKVNIFPWGKGGGVETSLISLVKSYGKEEILSSLSEEND